jgi:hypothetical protein
MKIKISLFIATLFVVSKLYGQISDNCVTNVTHSRILRKGINITACN